MMQKIIALVFVLINIPTVHYGQIFEDYEIEDLPELTRTLDVISDNDYAYIGGSGIYNDTLRTDIIKVDPLGNVIWTLNQVNPSIEIYGQVRKLMDGHDGFLYANVEAPQAIWKVDKQTGQIIYKSVFAPHSVIHIEMPRGGNTILAGISESINSTLKCTHIDKNTGNILSTFYPRNYYWNANVNDYHLTSDSLNNLYYIINDTIFKSGYNNPGAVEWFFVGNSATTYAGIQYEPAENVIYAIGRTSILSGGYITKIDATTGNVIWISDITSHIGGNHRFVQLKIKDNAIYTSWNTNSYPANQAPHIVKINRITGSFNWKVSQHFSNLPSLSHYTYDMTFHGDKLLYSGKDGAWKMAFMALDTSTGNKIYDHVLENVIPNFIDNGYGLSSQIVNIQNKVMIAGTVRPRVTTTGFMQLSLLQGGIIEPSTGQILTNKIYSSEHINPSSTAFLEAFPDGTIATARHMGRYGNIQLRDSIGNVIWEKNMVEQSGLSPYFGKIINDTTFIVSGLSYRYESDLNNPHITQAQNKFVTVVFSKSGNLLQTIYDDYKPLSCYLDGDSSKFYLLSYSIDNNAYRIAKYPLNSSTGIYQTINPATSIGLKENRILSLNNNNLLYFDNGVRRYSKTNFGLAPFGPFNYPINQFHYVKALNSSTGIALGQTSSNQFAVATFDLNTGDTLSVQISNNITDKGIRWERGESDSIIYVLMDNGINAPYVIKYNVHTAQVLWNKNFVLGNGDIVHVEDIKFNSIGQYLTIVGSLQTFATNDYKIIISTFDPSGNLVSNIVKDGDYTGTNKALTVANLPNSDKTLIGGSYINNNNDQAAFIYFSNKNVFLQQVSGNVFFDVNGNKIQDNGELNVSVGTITLDSAQQVYLDSDGTYRTYTSFDWHTVSLNLPSDWQLTTDSITYHYHPSFAATPISFGIQPQNINPNISTTIFGQALVCNQVKRFHIRVQNTGTSFENVLLKLNYEGTYDTASVLPDSLINDDIYWNLGEIPPGIIRNLTVDITIPSAAFLGDTLAYSVDAITYDTNTLAYTDSFEYIYEDVLLCAYDPNDKQVQPLGKDSQVSLGKKLTYTIRFQNTGNYPAQHIIITDTLDSDLNLNSFKFVGASHPITEVLREGNAVMFKFLNIYLPDSLNDEPNSHGFVAFKIDHKNSISVGTTVENTAHIYFDQNEAIVTNTTFTEFVEPFVSVSNLSKGDNNNYKIYPNPAHAVLYVEKLQGNHTTVNWSLINTLGQELKSGYLRTQQNEINISDLETGIYFLRVKDSIFKVMVKNQE